MKIPLILEPSPNFGFPLNYKWKNPDPSVIWYLTDTPPHTHTHTHKKNQNIFLFSQSKFVFVFFIPLFSWYQNMFLFNQNEFVFNKVYHYMYFSWCQKYFLFNQNKFAFNKKYLYHILFSHSTKIYFYYMNFPFSTFLGSISGLPFVSMKVRILLSVCWLS